MQALVKNDKGFPDRFYNSLGISVQLDQFARTEFLEAVYPG